MPALEHIELVVLGLLVAIAGLAVLTRAVRVPYPILLVLGGLGLGLVPGMPEVELDPDLVLLISLPPLLYAAAFFSNLRELRNNARPIGLLAIGLVIATMLAVAAVAHAVIGLDWPVAFVLGAIVSPTDAVAPATILRRLGVPRKRPLSWPTRRWHVRLSPARARGAWVGSKPVGGVARGGGGSRKGAGRERPSRPGRPGGGPLPRRTEQIFAWLRSWPIHEPWRTTLLQKSTSTSCNAKRYAADAWVHRGAVGTRPRRPPSASTGERGR